MEPALWVELRPPFNYVEILTPNISEYDPLWKQGLYRGNQVR